MQIENLFIQLFQIQFMCVRGPTRFNFTDAVRYTNVYALLRPLEGYSTGVTLLK